jgi:cytochrome c oxidase cbb3-type subunit 3
MPGWSTRLDPVTIKMLAAYVHSRGGGQTTETKEEVIEETMETSDEVAAATEGTNKARTNAQL